MRALAKLVAKQSRGVTVKFGRTNGRECLHLKSGKQSLTIYTGTEWDLHQWNTQNAPTKRQQREIDRDIAAAIENKEAI